MWLLFFSLILAVVVNLFRLSVKINIPQNVLLIFDYSRVCGKCFSVPSDSFRVENDRYNKKLMINTTRDPNSF